MAELYDVEVLGIDLSLNMLEIAAEKLAMIGDQRVREKSKAGTSLSLPQSHPFR